MTGEPIARVKGVSHRYGATVSLNDVSIDIPSRIMVGVIGPGRRRQVDAARAHRRREEDSDRRGRRLRQEHRRPGDLARDAWPHRLYAAGPRPQPLPDALRLREHRFLRPIVRIIGDGTSLQDRRASYGDEPGEVRSASCRQAFRRHEAEAEPLLRPYQRPGPSHPRRADHRRRSPVARPVLGPHQHHPRAPAADERHCGHRLYGRSGALRLADGDGRRQDHRHRYAEGAAGQDGRAQSRRGVHRHDARGQARPAQESGRASARSLPGRDAGDRGGGAHAPVWRFRRGRPRQLQDSPRRDLRLPRLEWMREIDDDENAGGLPAGEQRHVQAIRRADGLERHAGPAKRRIHDPGLFALRRIDGRAESRAPRPALSPSAGEGRKPHRGAARAL